MSRSSIELFDDGGPDEGAGARDRSADGKTCQWTSEVEALSAFAEFTGKTQSAQHIKPLHWYVACRLVVEGGFDPDDITPRPPFRVQWKAGRPVLHYDPATAGGGERTVLGGLKTKNVDVVATREGLGPVLAVSCKGVTGAFRNLTNRMEETIGECTNLHITYPALVLGYLVLLRANRQVEAPLDHAARVQGAGEPDASFAAAGSAGDAADAGLPARVLQANDIAVGEGGAPVESIVRFHNALRELVGRRGIRDDVSRYEAVGFGLVEMTGPGRGTLFPAYPFEGSPLRLERFFDTLYLQYDERFVTRAPDLASVTRRLEWAPGSPAIALPGLDYRIRVAGGA